MRSTTRAWLPADIDGLASAGYGGMHEVQLAEYLGLTPHWLEIDVVRRFELRVPDDARVPRDPGRRRRHGCDRLRQQPADARSVARWAPVAAGGGRGGGMAMPLRHGVRVPDRDHARRVLRDGRAASHAPVRHDARTARVDLGADARARGPQPERDVPRSDHGRRRARFEARRRPAAQARLLRDLRRRLLHHPHHRGTRP